MIRFTCYVSVYLSIYFSISFFHFCRCVFVLQGPPENQLIVEYAVLALKSPQVDLDIFVCALYEYRMCTCQFTVSAYD